MLGWLRIAGFNFFHCVRSVGKILSRKSGRVESLESQLSQQANFSHRGRAMAARRWSVVKEKKKEEWERQAEVSKKVRE